MKLNEVCTRSVVTARPEETLAAVALRMQEHNVGTVVVVEERQPSAFSRTATWPWRWARGRSAGRPPSGR
jgi:CBS domain-containing protein